MLPKPTVLSVFTGLGGLDLGLESAGFRHIGCIESNDVARESIRRNRKRWKLVDPADVLEAVGLISPQLFRLGVGELTLLAGAPPCQPFSNAALWANGTKRGVRDVRADPLDAFFVLVEHFLPKAILLENVPGFVRGQNSAISRLKRSFATINHMRGTSYSMDVRFLDACDFGVPQRRRRAIITAFRDGQSMVWPSATHSLAPIRAWDAIGGMKPRRIPAPSGRWTELLPTIPEGKNYLWHTNRGGGLSLFGYRTRYWSFLLKLAKDKPSWTIAAQPGPAAGPFHWTNRPLAITELLRLQSFPANWKVAGTQRQQVLQIGNATPPLLAEVVGRSILRTLGYRVESRAKLAIPRRRLIPPPEKTHPPKRPFVLLLGNFEDHPGRGLGPGARRRKKGSRK
jgi:DNA (cytosine-5)-methyltransferase 1